MFILRNICYFLLLSSIFCHYFKYESKQLVIFDILHCGYFFSFYAEKCTMLTNLSVHKEYNYFCL